MSDEGNFSWAYLFPHKEYTGIRISIFQAID